MIDLSEKIVSDYLGQIYYFSLKKTSKVSDAEDLTQEIMLEILTALERGTEISDLRAWIWKLARNRYARWADRKHRLSRNVNIDALGEVISDNSSVEDNILREEERALLYRELSLLSADYRKIVCAYYFGNKSVGEIAAVTSLSPGTIKRKLYESRQQIKEGMKMSRTYGTRSFSPENIVFTQNWDPATGEGGHRLIERLIPQNILLEAYDNPCTLEDLSLALGVAMPYLEDEIAPLVEYGLLLKDGGKYKTGIVILSKEVQEKLYDIGEAIADKLTPVIRAAIDEIGDNIPTDFPQSFEDFKPVLVDKLCSLPSKYRPVNYHTIKHHDGSEWAIMGLEKCDKNAPALEVWGNEKFNQIIILGNRTEGKELEIDPADVPAFAWDEFTEITKNSHNGEIDAIFNEFAELRDNVLNEAIPSYLRETALYGGNIDFRYLVMHRLIDEGYIKLHDDMNKTAMGVYNIK